MTSLSILRESIWSICGEEEGESMRRPEEEEEEEEGGAGRFLFFHRVGARWPLERGEMKDG